MASVNSLQSIQAWQETRSIFLRTFFSTKLLNYFSFPCTFLIWQKFSKMEISDRRSFAFLFLKKTRSNNGLQLGVTVHEFMLISICQCLCHIMIVSWSHGFKGLMVSMVSWFHRFGGVNSFMVS